MTAKPSSGWEADHVRRPKGAKLRSRFTSRTAFAAGLAAIPFLVAGLSRSDAMPAAPGTQEPWVRHVIDNSSKGADGVRLLDVNGDRFPDITTGWEEGGRIRVYLNPGRSGVRRNWPAVTAGDVGSPEDAVFVDLDGDGAVDVVSSCEGKQRGIFVHWAPKNAGDYLNEKTWRTEALPPASGVTQWMYTLPLQIDGKHGVDLIAGGKGKGTQIGWFEAPENPRDLGSWKYHRLYDAGWTMSLLAHDMDGDGDPDLLLSDRREPNSGVKWLENPGPGAAQYGPWTEHRVGGTGVEVMFLATADLDRDGLQDVVTAAKPRQILFHRRKSADGRSWEEFSIRIPDAAGTTKAVKAADIDLDGKMDLVFSCEQAKGPLTGVMWLSYDKDVRDPEWRAHDISGPSGVKYDLVELIDLDGDGDLDLITCEESENLGVVWYENPAR